MSYFIEDLKDLDLHLKSGVSAFPCLASNTFPHCSLLVALRATVSKMHHGNSEKLSKLLFFFAYSCLAKYII